MFVPVMWIIWSAFVLFMAVLYIYRSSLTKNEEDQIFLDDSFAHEILNRRYDGLRRRVLRQGHFAPAPHFPVELAQSSPSGEAAQATYVAPSLHCTAESHVSLVGSNTCFRFPI